MAIPSCATWSPPMDLPTGSKTVASPPTPFIQDWLTPTFTWNPEASCNWNLWFSCSKTPCFLPMERCVYTKGGHWLPRQYIPNVSDCWRRSTNHYSSGTVQQAEGYNRETFLGLSAVSFSPWNLEQEVCWVRLGEKRRTSGAEGWRKAETRIRIIV